MGIRTRTWEIVEAAEAGDPASRAFDSLILLLITLNVGAVVVGSVSAIEKQYGALLEAFELFSVLVFSVEYVTRMWACTADAQYHGSVWGRLRYGISAMAIVDLLAILPFYLTAFGADLRFVRALRLFRIVRVAKIGRYVSAFGLFGRVIRAKKEELVLTTGVMFVMLVVAACLMYHAENAAQPEQFPDIPSAMWWAVATLTTVGYGDVYPITAVGRLLGSVVAILGIGLFALPTGILGSAFVDEIQSKDKVTTCPHCGGQIDGSE